MQKYSGFAIAALLGSEVSMLKRDMQGCIKEAHKANYAVAKYLPHVTAVHDIPAWKILQFMSQLPTKKLDIGIKDLQVLHPRDGNFDVLAFSIDSTEIESVNYDLSGYLNTFQHYEFKPHVTIDFVCKEVSHLYESMDAFDGMEIPGGLETKGWVLYTPTGEQIVASVYNDNADLIQYVEEAA